MSDAEAKSLGVLKNSFKREETHSINDVKVIENNQQQGLSSFASKMNVRKTWEASGGYGDFFHGYFLHKLFAIMLRKI